MIWSKWTAFDKTWVATGEVVDYRRRAQTLSEVTAWGEGQVNLTGDGDPERVATGAGRMGENRDHRSKGETVILGSQETNCSFSLFLL
jgi:hypothetical protein